MPLIIALIGAIVAVYFWANRARSTRNTAGEVLDMANDVRLAARRFGFKRQYNLHPVESIEDARLAIAAIATSFIELDGLPTKEDRARLAVKFQTKLHANADEAQEMEVLGRWFMTECGGAEPAIARLSRKLFKLGGAEQLPPLIDTLQGSLIGELSLKQSDNLEDIQRALRPR